MTNLIPTTKIGNAGFTPGASAQPIQPASPASPPQPQQQTTNTTTQPVAPTGTPISQYVANSVNTPALPTGTEMTPVLQNVQANEQMQPINPIAPINVGPANQAQFVTITDPATGQAYQVDVNTILPYINQQAGQVEGTFTNPVQEMEAAQGEVSKDATVKGQLEGLYADTEDGQVPEWAQGAMRKAADVMAARGLGASSIAAGAITEAIQQSAIQIASQDAATYFQMDMKNLDNEQQARLENVRMRQQNMLTDVSIANATKQFNATNQQQMDQFVASMVTQIKTQNADRATAISQFNAGEINKIKALNAQNFTDVEKFNAQQENDIAKFQSQLDFNREVFNQQMGFAIDQSNVLWRRQVNTSNTAALNAANETNVQNKYNISQTSLNNLWQAWRDEAAWSFSSSEAEKDRAYNAAQAANNREFASRDDDDWMEALGQFAMYKLMV